jgi:hypothetical protein
MNYGEAVTPVSAKPPNREGQNRSMTASHTVMLLR